MTCINLLTVFGKQYRISFDPAYEPKHVPRNNRDSWMMQMHCAGRGVTIYPHGGDLLAVEVNGRRGVAGRLLAMGLRLHQDGHQEKTFLFPLGRFEDVAAVVHPRRRKRLSPERQQAAREPTGKVRVPFQKRRRNIAW